MSPINLSIVIPTWNREYELQRALNSIKPLLDSSSAIEVIVTDNCSSDKTLEVAFSWQKKYRDRFKVLQAEENKGPVLNWEKGFKASSAPFTLLLFSDDFLELSSISQFKLFADKLIPNLCASKITLVRLGVNLVDDNLKLSNEHGLSLCFDTEQSRPNSLATENKLFFILNHVLPRNLRLFRQSYSPVSPAGYILSTNYSINILEKYKNCHTFLKNGAGIDNLLILISAFKSKCVASISFATTCMVASSSSITHSSQQNPRKNLDLKESYFISEYLFAVHLIKHFNPLGPVILLLSLFRLIRVWSSKALLSFRVK